MLLLHISDIHFSTSDIDKPYDQNLGLRDDMINDIKGMTAKLGRSVDAILISGDIAYRGSKDEYDFALKWLKDELCPTSGCTIENVVVIPGNHDVDRRAASAPHHKAARSHLREVAMASSNAAITAYLDNEKSAQMMFDPIENYNRFAANFLCDIGFFNPATGKKPYSLRDFQLNDGSTLRVWGFNSVLVCDEHDNKDNMFVDPSAAQIVKREDGVTHLIMCHHPFGWLRNASHFRQRIERVAHVHLFGHEHNSRVEDHRQFTRIRAGAMHPDRDEPGWQPGYNFIDISVDGKGSTRRLNLNLWVRHYVDARFISANPDGDAPWHLPHSLEAWTMPQPPVVLLNPTDLPEDNTRTAGAGMTDTPLTIRSVAIKILAISEHDQRRIITKLNLDQEGDQGLQDYEFALAAVKRAHARGQLQDLSDAIDEQTGVK